MPVEKKTRVRPSFHSFDEESKKRLRLAAKHFGMSMNQVLRHLINAHLPSIRDMESKLETCPTGVSFLKPEEEEKTPNIKDVVDDDSVRIDWDSVKKWWNKSASVLLNKPKIKSLSHKRKSKVKKRIQEDAAVLDLIVEEAHKIGPFYLNAYSWGTFDWLFNSRNNLDKFLEGNYREPDAKVEDVPALWQPPSWFPQDWRHCSKHRKIATSLGCPTKELREEA